MTGSGAPAAGFRPEVQALRAAAVLLVVFFHLWPGRVPGGYIGVDVFFVISGFLITSHLLKEVERTGRVGLGSFWARRARRLLPAAYLVLATSAVAVALWMPVATWTQNFKEIIGSALYVQNWVLAADAVDYLAADNAPSAVQHYWTLSVEEQFYLVWPLLVGLALLLAKRLGRSRIATITVVLGTATAVCFVYSLWITATNPQLAYFASPARAWQFGAGALFAIAAASPRLRPPPNALAVVLSWGGFAALAGCGLVYDESTPFPGTAAILPAVATLAIIWAGVPTGPASPGPLLRWRPVQVTGDISYSMYLWHWPPIVILPELLDRELGLWPRVGILVATFALAWLTKTFVEDPVRSTRRFGMRRPAVTGLASALAAVIVVGAASSGFAQGRDAEQEAAELTAAVNADMPRCFGAASFGPVPECDNPALADLLVPEPADVGSDFADYPECWVDNDSDQLKSCTFGDTRSTDRPHLVLIGDSHARALLPAFERLADLGHFSFTAQLKAGCAWSADDSNETDLVQRQTTCRGWKAELSDWLDTNADGIDLIVTTGYAKLLAGSMDDRVDGLAEAWTPVAERGVPVVALSDNPYHETSPSKCLERTEDRSLDACSTTPGKAFRFGDPFKRAAQVVPDAVSLDLSDYYCDRERCPSVIGGVNVYRDNSHFTITYTRTLAPFLLRELERTEALRVRR